jgi:ABC-type nitrate/sulfonate/bicarbonate transport system permease component
VSAVTHTSQRQVAEAAAQEGPPTTMETGVTGPWWTRLDRRATIIVLLVEFAAILAIWQVAIGGFALVNPVFLPPPSEIAQGFATVFAREDIMHHVMTTLTAWSVGFALATVVGIALGVTVGGSLPVERLSAPVLWTIYATPWLAYRPLSVIWFGFGMPPIIFLVFIAALFPVLLNTAAGVRTVDRSLLQASDVFGISRWDRYRNILLPSALPFLFVGLRQSAVMATIALIVAEMTGSSVGLGALISILTNRYQTEQTFALVAIAVVWTVLVTQTIRFIGQRVAPWQTDARSA